MREKNKKMENKQEKRECKKKQCIGDYNKLLQ